MYHQGVGVDKDDTKAFELLTQAADSGFKDAYSLREKLLKSAVVKEISETKEKNKEKILF